MPSGPNGLVSLPALLAYLHKRHIRSLMVEGGATVISNFLAAHLADRLVLLSQGRVVAAGPLHELLERLDLQPATGRFEAGVVLETRVEHHDERFRLTHVRHGAQALVVPMTDVPVGTVLRLRIRARDVALATAKRRAGRRKIRVPIRA